MEIDQHYNKRVVSKFGPAMSFHGDYSFPATDSRRTVVSYTDECMHTATQEQDGLIIFQDITFYLFLPMDYYNTSPNFSLTQEVLG